MFFGVISKNLGEVNILISILKKLTTSFKTKLKNLYLSFKFDTSVMLISRPYDLFWIRIGNLRAVLLLNEEEVIERQDCLAEFEKQLLFRLFFPAYLRSSCTIEIKYNDDFLKNVARMFHEYRGREAQFYLFDILEIYEFQWDNIEITKELLTTYHEVITILYYEHSTIPRFFLNNNGLQKRITFLKSDVRYIDYHLGNTYKTLLHIKDEIYIFGNGDIKFMGCEKNDLSENDIWRYKVVYSR